MVVIYKNIAALQNGIVIDMQSVLDFKKMFIIM